MSEQYDPFSPHRVDESVEHLASTSPFDDTTPIEPEKRMVRDMQRLYGPEHKQYLRALQRVEDRLVERYVTKGEHPAAVPLSPGQQQESPRKIQQGRLYSMENKRNSNSGMAKFGRRVSLLAAVLVMVVLVGSLVVVMNVAHHPAAPGNHTTTGSGPNGTPGPTLSCNGPNSTPMTPTPTPGGSNGTSIPATPGRLYVTPTPSGPNGTPGPIPTCSGPNGTPIPPTPTIDPSQQSKIVYTSPASMDDFYAFAWSPDGKRVASSTNSQVQIWDATTGKHPVVFNPNGQGGSVLALSWSPDGRSLAVGSGQVQIIDPLTGAVKQTFPKSLASAGSSGGSHLSSMNPFSGGNMVYATAWSPDGTLMATSLNGAAYGNVVEVWNVITGQVINTFRGQSHGQNSGVNSLSWSHDGKDIVSAAYDGTVQVWDAHTSKVIFNQKGLPYATWAPTGTNVAFISDANTIQVWNVATNKMVTSHSGATNNDLAWSPDGKQIASGSGRNVVIWDATTGTTTSTFSGQGNNVRSLAWSPDGNYIVSGGNNELGGNYAKVWRV